jgi:pimeloyl-ACP methyl ester carboxylesterase
VIALQPWLCNMLQGGYLSARYALAHPDHVEHLILVCSAGVVGGNFMSATQCCCTPLPAHQWPDSVVSCKHYKLLPVPVPAVA